MNSERMQKIFEIIKETLNSLNDVLPCPVQNIDLDTKLFGGDGILDSIALVMLISDMEQKIANEFNVNIILTDEKAMSRASSPFRTVSSLINLIEEKLEETK